MVIPAMDVSHRDFIKYAKVDLLTSIMPGIKVSISRSISEQRNVIARLSSNWS